MMMVKKPRKPTNKEIKQLIDLMVKEDDGLNEREAIADEYRSGCIAVFDIDPEKPEDNSKTMIVVWPGNLEVTQAFAWEKEELYRVQINP